MNAPVAVEGVSKITITITSPPPCQFTAEDFLHKNHPRRRFTPQRSTAMSDANTAAEPWKICYQQLAPKLLLYARQWMASPADAEDVVQTAFVRFWRKNPDAQPEHYPLAYAAVRSAALDLIRSDGRRAQRETRYHAEEFGAAVTFFDSTLEEREDASAVEQALRQLPAEQREVVVLRIWGELTFAQIATTLQESINTVASRYRYGIEALRKILSPHLHERV